MTNTTNELSRHAAISRLLVCEAYELLMELEYHADDMQQGRLDLLFATVRDGKGYWIPEK
jgi:hypothetical protein